MNDKITIRINTNKISPNVGNLKAYNGNKSLYIDSMMEFRKWVIQQIPSTNPKNTMFVVCGPMPNCAALQIGLILAGKGTVVFETTKQYIRKMEDI